MAGSPPLLRHDANFRWYWLSQTLSLGGSQAIVLALPLAVAISLDGGPAAVSIVTTAAFLPNLLLSLFTGHLLERRSKRQVMIWTDALRAVTLLVVPLAWLTDNLMIPLLAVVAFVSGTLSVFFDVSGFAFIPTLVPKKRLAEANQAIQGSATVAQVAGPGLAGLLMQAFGAPLALLIDAASYVASVFGLSRVRGGEDWIEPGQDTGRMRDGVMLLMRNVHLRALTVDAAGV